MKKTIKMVLYSTVAIALLSGCSQNKIEPKESVMSIYNVQCCQNKTDLKKDFIKRFLKETRYPFLSGDSSFGIQKIGFMKAKDGTFFFVTYENNIKRIDGVIKTYVTIKTKVIFNESNFKKEILLNNNLIIETDGDSDYFIDNINNLKDDFRLSTGMKVQSINDYTSIIPFDPKRVEFGTAVAVENGVLKNRSFSNNGVESIGCLFENKEKCKNAYYQSISVKLDNGININIIQSITDARYQFITNGEKVNCFKTEYEKWLVLPKQ